MKHKELIELISKTVEVLLKWDVKEYQITGTSALSLLGVNPNYKPKDLDIKVFNPNQRALNNFQLLNELNKPNKPDGYVDSTKIFTLNIYGQKVNIICEGDIPNGCRNDISITVSGGYTVPIQPVNEAITDKAKLNRVKDKEYFTQLLKDITQII